MSTTKVDSTSQIPPQAPTQAGTNPETSALNEGYLANFQASTPLGSYQSNIKTDKQRLNLSFCPKCKMLLRTINNNPSTLRCKKCGYHLKLGHHAVYGGKTLASNKHSDKIAVIDKENGNLHTFPVVQAICERCGKTESETWTIAVGSEGTVSALVFLRCVNCGFTRREVG